MNTRSTRRNRARSSPPGTSRADSRQRKPRHLAGWALLLTVVAFDALAIAFTSQLLWMSGGHTVRRGSEFVLTAAFITCTLCAAARIVTVRRSVRLRDSRLLWSAVGVLESVLALSCLYLGVANSSYRLCWIAAFAGGYMLMNAIIQAVLIVLFRLGRGPVVAGLVQLVAALVVLAFTSHVWGSNGVLGDLLVLAGGALLAAEVPAALAGLAFPPETPSEA